MASVCSCFQVHQPHRLRPCTVFDVDSNYFDEAKNAEICRKVTHKSYLPANRVLLELIKQHRGRFKVSLGMTGVLLEQLQQCAPEVITSFQELAATGCVEFLAETYYHSFSSLYSPEEFLAQVELHRETIQRLFGQRPQVFRNTGLVYNNDLAALIERLGEFGGILAEGTDHILGHRSPNFVYRPRGCSKLKVLLRNYRLSDDIAFRFSNRHWDQWPITADRFAAWINSINGNGHIANLSMDYETFGEHQWEETGIFDFLRYLPAAVLEHPDNDFKTPSEVVSCYEAIGDIDAPSAVNWADVEQDLSAWLGNDMQQDAITDLYRLENEVKATGVRAILEDWRKLQVSDHFYYMDIRHFSGGDVQEYFNPYDSPYDAYINFMTALDDLRSRCSRMLGGAKQALMSVRCHQPVLA